MSENRYCDAACKIIYLNIALYSPSILHKQSTDDWKCDSVETAKQTPEHCERCINKVR
jgi:hypothetical protein